MKFYASGFSFWTKLVEISFVSIFSQKRLQVQTYYLLYYIKMLCTNMTLVSLGYMAYGVWHMACSIWRVVYGAWYVIYGIWHVAYSTWSMVCGIWRVVYGAWRMMAYGILRMMYKINENTVLKMALLGINYSRLGITNFITLRQF